jgi:uncharacterized protein YndB with AHSA1/START domain
MNETLEQRDGRWLLGFERKLKHSPHKVWRVLTEPAELAHWFPAAIEGERSQGAALRFVFAGQKGGAQDGVMRVFDPPRLLEYAWADEILRWEIVATADGTGCSLIFTHIIKDRSSVTRSAAGWDLCIERMQSRLAGGSASAAAPSWAESYARFQALFGFGDFPACLRAQESRVDGFLFGTPGVEAHAFKDASGGELLLWRATQDAETASHRYERQAYLLVIEGSYELQLGGGKVTLSAGSEFHFPPGLPIAGSVKRGTRGVLGLGPKLPT